MNPRRAFHAPYFTQGQGSEPSQAARNLKRATMHNLRYYGMTNEEIRIVEEATAR